MWGLESAPPTPRTAFTLKDIYPFITEVTDQKSALHRILKAVLKRCPL